MKGETFMSNSQSVEEITEISKCCRLLNANTKLLKKHLGNENHILVSMYSRLSRRIKELDKEKKDEIYILKNMINSLAYEVAKYRYPNQYGFSDEQINQIIREHCEY